MNRKNEKELNVFRVENKKLRHKIETTEKMENDQSNWTGSNERKDPKKEIKDEMSKFQQSDNTFGSSFRRQPFTKNIMETEPPSYWKGSTLDRYDESIDPDDHIDIYITQIELYRSDDNIFCKVFPTSLERPIAGSLAYQ